MPYLLPVVLAFAAGFLMGYVLQAHWQRATWRLRWASKKRIPRRCPVCGAWCATGNMRQAEHKAAGRVLICRKCWDAQYRPFSTRESH